MDTQDPILPLRADALLSHSDWVRALVRGLGIRESDADDVVQATWVAALTSPPRAANEGASLRAWVARVARNFALKRLGGDHRRAARERDGAREERLPSTADVVEREEARAQVVRALLDVHEPYRTTLLLRFYEGLEPRDIARRQGVPDSTVRNRLKRGLVHLRERLESVEGASWKQRCLLVLPALRTAPPGTGWLPRWAGAGATSGGALATKALGVAATVALVAGGLTIVWKREANEERASSPVALAAGATSAERSGTSPASRPAGEGFTGLAAETARGGAGTREPASAARDAHEEGDDGSRCTVRGTLRSADGAPLKSIQLPFLGVRGLARELLAKSEERIFEAVDDVTTGVEDPSSDAFASTDAGGITMHVDVGVGSSGREPERLSKSFSGAILEDVSVTGERGVALEQHGRVVIASSSGDAREVDVDGEGNFEFGDLRPGRWHLYATAPACMARRMDFEIRREDEEKRLEVTLLPVQALRVRMVTPEGRDLLESARTDKELGDAFLPVPFAVREAPGSRITDLGEDPSRCYAAGCWRDRSGIDEKAAGEAAGVLLLVEGLPLHVGVSVRGVVLDERVVAAGAEEVVFVIPLDRVRAVVASVSVRVVSAQDGLPIANAQVEIEGGGDALADDGGVAVLARVPPGHRRIRFEAEGVERRSEWIDVEPGAKNEIGVREVGLAVPIRGRIVDGDGAPVVTGVQLRALEGRVPDRELALVEEVETDAEGNFRFERAGARRYLVQVAGEDWAAPTTTIDAQPGPPPEIVIEAARCDELKLTFPVEPTPDARYVVETGADSVPVAVRPCEAWQPLAVRLGTGDYRVRILDGARTLWMRHVLVEPGQAIAFDEPGSVR